MNNKLSVSQKKLRTLSRRALRIVERHKALDTGFATVGAKLVPAAQAYIQAYDQAVKDQITQGQQMSKGRQSVAVLEQHLRKSLAVVRYVLPEFDASTVTSRGSSPDQLIASGYKVIELLSQAGDAVFEGHAAINTLKAAVEKAELLSSQAQAARVNLQHTQGTVREHALLINHELIALRRVLRAALGTRHLDFQMLRASRVTNPEVIDEDDSLVADEPGATSEHRGAER